MAEPLPLILLGPILRRTDENQVCIWLACSKSVTIKATVLRLKDLTGSQAKPLGSGMARSLRLGQHLHVALVAARPITINVLDKFPTDELLAYDIEIVDDSGKTSTLKDLGLLSGKNTIAYEHNGASLPTFFLPGNNTPLNLLHGSCRKLHGKGEDCLFAADAVIMSSFADLKKRPSVLFLTGDQIYADDVAEPLANYMTQLGFKLLGWEEQIRGVNRKLSQIRPGDRQKIIKEFAGFTAGHASNHLLGFSEFAAMYMVAWNAGNWPDRLEVPDVHDNKKGNYKYKEQAKQLEGARRDLGAVRRVLANIPTYMIFDDHEITDDWNLTLEWHDSVQASECGKQIVANGLAAYWAFQGWGNDPSQFSNDFIARFADYFGGQDEPTSADTFRFEAFLLNFHGWAFSAPTNPLTIFADSRTQRHYDSFKGAPQLLGEEALLTISEIAEAAKFKKGDPLVIVVPSPVLGFYLIEALQKIFALLTSVYTFDLESWFANTAGRIKLLTFLLKTFAPKHCIFLSGDVHFGFTIKSAFAPLQQGQGDDILTITQLNSSAMKTTSLVKIAFISEILGRMRQMFPFKRLVRTGRLDRLRSVVDRRYPDWVEARAIVHASGSLIPPLIISDNNIGLVRVERDLSAITHKLLVRKANEKIKVHQSVIALKNGKNLLEDSVRKRIIRLFPRRLSG